MVSKGPYIALSKVSMISQALPPYVELEVLEIGGDTHTLIGDEVAPYGVR